MHYTDFFDEEKGWLCVSVVGGGMMARCFMLNDTTPLPHLHMLETSHTLYDLFF